MGTALDGTGGAAAGEAGAPAVELEVLRAAVELAPGAALLLDEGDRVLACSAGLRSVVGGMDPEPTGPTLYDFGLRLQRQEEDAPAGDPGVENVALDGQLTDGSVVRLGGQSRPVRAVGLPSALRYVVLAPDGPRPAGAQDADEMLRLLVDTAQEYAIFTLDVHGCVASWNPGAQRMKGYRADQILGRHFSTFYTSEDVERGHPRHELAIAAEQGRHCEEGWRVRSDGSRFWASVTIIALREPGGQLRGFGKVTQDVTGRRAAEEALQHSEQRFRELAESLNDAYVLADSEPGDGTGAHRWRVRYAGGAFARVFGLDPEDLVAGRCSVLDVVHPGDLGRLRAVWSRPDLGGVRELLFRIVRAGDGTRLVRARYRWLPDGHGPRRVACVLEDVTETLVAQRDPSPTTLVGLAQLLEAEEVSEPLAEALALVRGAGRQFLGLAGEGAAQPGG